MTSVNPANPSKALQNEGPKEKPVLKMLSQLKVFGLRHYLLECSSVHSNSNAESQ